MDWWYLSLLYPGSGSHWYSKKPGDAKDWGAKIDAPVPNIRAENPIKKLFLKVDNNFFLDITWCF